MKRARIFNAGLFKGWANYLVLCALVMALFFAGTTPSYGEAKAIRFAIYTPQRGLEGEAMTWLTDEIEKRTKGAVKFQNYFAGSLLKERETLRGVQSGAADMGYIFVPYFPRELTLWSIGEPFIRGPVDPAKKAEFFTELYEQSPELQAVLNAYNQKLVAIHYFGQMAAGGPRPLKSLNDLKGMRVRCAGGYDAEHMTALGAKVVFLPGTEIYSAMEKGAVQANYTAFISYFKYRLFEIGKQHTVLVVPQFTGSVALITINKKVWDGLSPEVQKVISEVGKEYGKKIAGEIKTLEVDIRSKMKAAGATVVDVPVSEVNAWADASEKESLEKWIKKAEEQKQPGKALMERAKKLAEKYSK
ncbi:MAG TPA: TRAP transporter substrate-binding protein DctP [Syntrophorhabdaceae bacterium]|nr:TRAP transporter substrate-binding protein DctP [Syntrophorhabdaceae bacterium]HQM80312.1 TRAP transporter substrate-binding protein DctP [Syntrophorhabdaceae bacterium]